MAKLWCGDEAEGGRANAYGFPAFDAGMNVLGFYREVYDTDDTFPQGASVEEKNAIGVFIPITADVAELGGKQRTDMREKLGKEIAAKSQSVHKIVGGGGEDELKKLIEEGFTYAWTKVMNTESHSNNTSFMDKFW
jgi:hypothetical protein